MRTRTVLAGGLAAILSLSALAFHATAPEGATDASATRDGDTVTFHGFANTPDPGQSTVPGAFFLTPFQNADVADAIGIDLQDGLIEETEDGSGLRFTWQLGSDLPPEGVPEGVRYNWSFQAGDQTYQLQAKRSNLASVTTPEAPVDHVVEAAEGDWWFQLRGACTANYLVEQNPVAGCYHLGFFDGDVDTATGTVSMVLPYEAQDSIGRVVAGTFQRGTPISENQSAGMSITASAQAMVSNTASSAYINGWGTYYPGTAVSVALGDAGGPTSAYTQLDTPGDGSFAGSLSGAGTHLWVKACSGYAVQGVDPEPCIEGGHVIG